MTVIRKAALAAAIMTAASAFAQTTQGQDAQHPVTGAPPAQAQPAPLAGGTTGPGMPGPGMMGAGPGVMGPGGQGMMGPGGMGGDTLDNMRRMMGMMSMMGAGMRPGAQHIEGRLAFLKTELKITDAQAPQWNAFAEAVRANAKAMADTHQQALSQGAPTTLPDRLALERKAMTAHLDALNRTTGALDKLYDALSDEQKKIADEIVVGPMGMPMGMM